MPYRQEKFVIDNFYHIVLRRPDNLRLFSSDRDRLRFLTSAHLVNHLPPYLPYKLSRWDNTRMLRTLNGVEALPEEWRKSPHPLANISSFILMRTHVHFLLKQVTEGGIIRFIQRTGDSYAKYFNTKYERKGPLFEGAFTAVPVVDDRQFRYVVGYIHLNALDTKGVKWRSMTLRGSWKTAKEALEQYQWSSYNYFTGGHRFEALINGDLAQELFPTPQEFQTHLKQWQWQDDLVGPAVQHLVLDRLLN